MDIKCEPGYTDVYDVEERFKKGQDLKASKSELLEDDWLTKGELQFKNFTCRYRPELNPALNEINLRIKPGRKIGVIGRTGAGKTT